ncbi:LOW QUALITY PROTEIN: dexamethasone-induced Ras-related protein 1 [Rhynchocyon petersi]
MHSAGSSPKVPSGLLKTKAKLLTAAHQQLWPAPSGTRCDDQECLSDSDLSILAENYYRMVILGSSRVGKTAIVSGFLTGHLEDTYTPHMVDFHYKFYSIQGTVVLQLCGHLATQFAPFHHSFLFSLCPTGDVFMLVFSLDCRRCFEEVQRLKQVLDTKSCLRNKTKQNVDVPLVICGDKGNGFHRKVEQEIGQLVGDEPQRWCAYFETLAQNSSSLDPVFQAFCMAKLPSEMSLGSNMHSDLLYLRKKGGGGGQSKNRVRCVTSFYL